jgi:uncharacterized protein YbjT (DUF2867 family)
MSIHWLARMPVMIDRVLVTGGTGKTGQLVARQLALRGIEARIATRTPSLEDQIRFDWNEPATYGPALEGAAAVYIVAPTDRTEQLPVMRPFLEQAVSQVPGRLVLLSASSLEAGDPMMGEIHAWLAAHAPLWAVLRPSWFMQNITTQHLPSILHEGCLYSATGDGRVAFIDAADIAAVAVEALTNPALPSGEHVLTGPEALTYDEVADAISARIGRSVSHCRLSVQGLAARYAGCGMPRSYALMLAGMDKAIAHGSEDRITWEVERIAGRRANTLAHFLENQRALLAGPF